MGPEGFFWRTTDSLTVQDKQGTHEQLSLNKHTAVDHSENNTVLRIKGVKTSDLNSIYICICSLYEYERVRLGLHFP